jgi:outer membrane protein, heavy metal efflux system
MEPRTLGFAALLGACCAWSAGARAEELRAQTLEELEAALDGHHPRLGALEAALDERQAEREGAGAVMAPELVAQTWAAPLDRPYALGRSEMLMLGARARLPRPAVRRAEREAASSALRVASEALDLARLALRADLRASYVALWAAQTELAALARFAEQLATSRRMLEARYAAGVGEGESLAALELTEAELSVERAELEGALSAYRARTNLLVGRSADAPLQVAPPPPPTELPLPAQPTPGQRLGSAAVEAAERTSRAAALAAQRPELSVGVDYMAMASAGDYARYGAMLGITLPWLSRAGAAAARVASTRVETRRAELRAVEHAEALAVADGNARLAAARARLAILETVLEPALTRAEQQTARRFVQGDASGAALLEQARARLTYERAHIAAESAAQLAAIELERTTGRDLHDHPGATP